MAKWEFTKSYASIALLVLCAIVLAIVPLLRNADAGYAGEDAYFNLRMEAHITGHDDLSYGGRFAGYALGLPFILGISPHIMNSLLPFMLGILCFLLFRLLLKEFEFQEKNIALLVLLASPTFIYTFSTINNYMFPIFLTLLGSWLMLKRSRMHLLAIPAFAIMPAFNFTMTLISLFVLLLLAAYKAKERMWLYYIILFATVLITGLYYGFIIRNSGFEWLQFNAHAAGFNAALQRLVSDMGSYFGIAVFGVALAIIGMISQWGRKYRDLFVFFSVFTLMILMFFRTEAVFYLNFFIAAFAVMGLKHLINKRWENKTLKNLIIYALVCGLLFSAVSNASRIIQSLPDAGIIEGISYLNGLPEDTVFADYSRGFWINYAGKKNVMDVNFRFAPEVNERWADSQTLFYTRDWNTARGIIEKYDIRYIWIDEEMKEQVWSREDEGLLFLLKYSKTTIHKIYDKDGVEIWEVEG